jgi:hypothetical protein
VTAGSNRGGLAGRLPNLKSSGGTGQPLAEGGMTNARACEIDGRGDSRAGLAGGDQRHWRSGKSRPAKREWDCGRDGCMPRRLSGGEGG